MHTNIQNIAFNINPQLTIYLLQLSESSFVVADQQIQYFNTKIKRYLWLYKTMNRSISIPPYIFAYTQQWPKCSRFIYCIISLIQIAYV